MKINGSWDSVLRKERLEMNAYFTIRRNALPYLKEDRIDRPDTDAGQPGRIAGRQIQGKCLHQMAKSGLTDLGIFVVSVFPFIHRSKRVLACNLLHNTQKYSG